MMGRCVKGLWQRTRSTRSAASTEEPEPDRTVQSFAHCIEQPGGFADMERQVPELYDWVQKNNEAAPEMRCAILDVVS